MVNTAFLDPFQAPLFQIELMYLRMNQLKFVEDSL